MLIHVFPKLSLVSVAFELSVVGWLWRKVSSMYSGIGGPEKSSGEGGLELSGDLELVEVMKSIILLLL